MTVLQCGTGHMRSFDTKSRKIFIALLLGENKILLDYDILVGLSINLLKSMKQKKCRRILKLRYMEIVVMQCQFEISLNMFSQKERNTEDCSLAWYSLQR